MTSQLRAVLAVAAVLAVLALTAWAYRQAFHHEREKAQAAQQQATNNAASAQAADRVFTTTAIVREKADHAAQQIQAAPHADDPVPPDVLGAWAAGVDSLRDTSGQPLRPHDVP